jgi:hypothetical protein
MQFNPEACHQEFREKVAAIHGYSPEIGRLDGRELFYLQLLHQIGMLRLGKYILDWGAGVSAFGPIARAIGLEVTIADDFAGGGAVDLNQMDKTRFASVTFGTASNGGITLATPCFADMCVNQLLLT